MRMCSQSFLLLSGLVLGTAAIAGEPAAPQEANVYFNGVKVAIDPATGKLRQPTAAEIRQLRAAAGAQKGQAQSLGKPMPKTRAEAYRTVRTLADGSVMMEVPEEMMSSVVATRQADGSIRIQHAGEQTNTTQEDLSK